MALDVQRHIQRPDIAGSRRELRGKRQELVFQRLRLGIGHVKRAFGPDANQLAVLVLPPLRNRPREPIAGNTAIKQTSPVILGQFDLDGAWWMKSRRSQSS